MDNEPLSVVATLELGIFSPETLDRMYSDAEDVAASPEATPERRLAAHQAIDAIHRTGEAMVAWIGSVGQWLDVLEIGGEG